MIPDREWLVAVLAEEEPTQRRKAELFVALRDLDEQRMRLCVEIEQCDEQLRECQEARKTLYATAPKLPGAVELEEKIAEQYAIVVRLRHRGVPIDEKLIEAEEKLRILMTEREPYRAKALLADGGVNG